MSVPSDEISKRFIDNPPIMEAVAGVEFRPRSFDLVRVVNETSRWIDDYPLVTTQPPLDPSRPVGQPTLETSYEFIQGVPPARMWSVSNDQHWLVQSQDDRLLLNWRKVSDDGVYPNFDATIRPKFESLLSKLDIAEDSDLEPLVSEFSYFNHIKSDEPGLEQVYSIFRRPEQALPGTPLTEQYRAVMQLETEWGAAQLTVLIQPLTPERSMTQLTVTTKVFAGRQLSVADTVGMVDIAHKTSKQAFFAIVRDSATK